MSLVILPSFPPVPEIYKVCPVLYNPLGLSLALYKPRLSSTFSLFATFPSSAYSVSMLFEMLVQIPCEVIHPLVPVGHSF